MDSSVVIQGRAIHGVSFFCTKLHKWKGSYPRVVTIGNEGLATYNIEKGTLTNYWEWKDIENISADKPGSHVFTLSVRNGKTSTKLSFRSLNSAEILSEARSHLIYDSSKPSPYLFTGSKICRKCGEDKEVEFIVKSGHLWIHFVKEDRIKLIPIYCITDVALMNDDGQIMLEVFGRSRLYELRERFGFITALVNEMNLCDIEKDARQRLSVSPLQRESLPCSDPVNHSVYKVHRIHNPLCLLSSIEMRTDEVPEGEDSLERYLYVSENGVEEVIKEENSASQVYSIPYSSIVGFYQAITNGTIFYMQFQSKGFLRLLAFSCDQRDDLFCLLYSVLSPSLPAGYPFLPNPALRFHGTTDNVTDIGNTCIHSIQTNLHEMTSLGERRRSSSVHSDEFSIRHSLLLSPSMSTLSFDSIVTSCEAYLINSRYFSSHYEMQLDEKKGVITHVISIILDSCDMLKKGVEVEYRDICILLLFLQSFICSESAFSSSFLVSSFESLFSSICSIETSCIQFCYLLLLKTLSSYSSYHLLSSFASSTVLLEFLIHSSFSSSSSLFSVMSIELLIKLIMEQSSLPPPLPLYETISACLKNHMPQLYSLLLIPSSLQPSFFQVFYSIILFSTEEIRSSLQVFAFHDDTLLTVLLQALFGSEALPLLMAKGLLVLLAYKNTEILNFIQRILPQEFSRMIHSPCSIQKLGELIDLPEHFPTFADGLAWKEIAALDYPADGLNFPAFFSLFMSDVNSYRVVWGSSQREEVKKSLTEEIEKWKSRSDGCIWNSAQFIIPYTSYNQHLHLYGYSLQQLANLPISIQTSSLERLFNEPSSNEHTSIEVQQPLVLLLSIWSRFLAAESEENKLVLLKTMRIVAGLYPTECGEFFDSIQLLKIYEKEENLAIQIALVEVIQSLCLNPKNQDFFCYHASVFVPLLLRRLLSNHKEFNEGFCLCCIDLLYGLLHSAKLHVYPPSDLAQLLTSSQHLLEFANLLFLPSEHLSCYVVYLLLLLIELDQDVLSKLNETLLTDCLLLGYSQWRVSHVQLLKLVIKKNNSLAGILPDAVLYGLEMLPEDRFISLYQADTISSTIIWTQSMREHLAAILHLHSDSYKQQLTQDPSLVYVVLPLPHIHYAELEGEVYCGRYYLNQLLNVEPLLVKNVKALLVSIKNEWVREGKRKGLKLSMDEACSLVGVEGPANEEVVISKVWEKWLEVKTKEERDDLLLAEDILTGYAITDSSPVFPRLLLLIRIQNELYLNYAHKLKSFSYPSFDVVAAQSLLLINHSNHEEVNILALELCRVIYHTCSISSDNTEMFIRKNGMTVISNLLQWNDMDVKNESECSLDILYSLLLTLVHLSQSLSLHSILIESELVTNYLVIYLSYDLPIALKLLIVDYFMNMLIESTFRNSLLHLPVNLLNSAIPLLFMYNRDAEETREKQLNEQCMRLSTSLKHSSRSSSTSDISLPSDLALTAIPGQLTMDPGMENIVVKEIEYKDVKCDSNMLARHVVQLLSISANNWSTAVPVLNSLFTKSLVSLLLELNTDTFLTILNSEFYSSPFIIWSANMKEQLLVFLQNELKVSLAGENHFIEDSTHFVFTAIQHELIIADVYVRVFNEQNPKDFVKGSKYLAGILQYLASQRDDQTDAVIQNKEYVNAMLTSIDLLLSGSASLESVFQTPDDLFTLFSFLLPQRGNDKDIWDLHTISIDRLIHTLTILTEIPRISIMIIQSQFIDILLRLLYQGFPDYYAELFAVIVNICQHAEDKTPLLITSNLWLFIFYSAIHSLSSPISLQALSVLQSWLNQEAVHDRLTILLRHLIPEYLIQSISHGNFLQLVSTTTVTAEIIWNATMKAKLLSTVTSEYEKYVAAFLEGSEYHFSEKVEYEQISNEPVVGGVFIRVYDAGNYQLSNPQFFLTAISNTLLQYIRDEVNMERKPRTAEEEKTIKEDVFLLETAFVKCCDIENTVVLDAFEVSGLLNEFIVLWEIMRLNNQLHSPFNGVICSLFLKISENAKCLGRIVLTNEVLRILLECLRLNTKNCVDVSSLIYSLFKSKSTELCKFLNELNVISSLIACLENPVQVVNESGEEDVEKKMEVLMYLQKALICIEKIQFMDGTISSQLELNHWNDYKNVSYSM